jgi:hypothetical protein
MPAPMMWCVLPSVATAVKPACIDCMLIVCLVPARCTFYLPQHHDEEEDGRFNHGQGHMAVIGAFVLL